MRTTPDPLLEVASQRGGGSPAGRSAGVHPTLGAIVRAVHAHSSEQARAELRPLAPRLTGTAAPGVETSARLVAMCTSAALACPRPHHTTDHEHRRLLAARQSALYLLRGGSVGYAMAAVDPAEPEPRLCGATRCVPVLRALRLGERFYRRLAGAQAAAAVSVVARASGADQDRRLRQLLTMCIALTPGAGAAPAPPHEEDAARERSGGEPAP